VRPRQVRVLDVPQATLGVGRRMQVRRWMCVWPRRVLVLGKFVRDGLGESWRTVTDTRQTLGPRPLELDRIHGV
jgi:hypothetical protein